MMIACHQKKELSAVDVFTHLNVAPLLQLLIPVSIPFPDTIDNTTDSTSTHQNETTTTHNTDGSNQINNTTTTTTTTTTNNNNNERREEKEEKNSKNNRSLYCIEAQRAILSSPNPIAAAGRYLQLMQSSAVVGINFFPLLQPLGWKENEADNCTINETVADTFLNAAIYQQKQNNVAASVNTNIKEVDIDRQTQIRLFEGSSDTVAGHNMKSGKEKKNPINTAAAKTQQSIAALSSSPYKDKGYMLCSELLTKDGNVTTCVPVPLSLEAGKILFMAEEQLPSVIAAQTAAVVAAATVKNDSSGTLSSNIAVPATLSGPGKVKSAAGATETSSEAFECLSIAAQLKMSLMLHSVATTTQPETDARLLETLTQWFIFTKSRLRELAAECDEKASVTAVFTKTYEGAVPAALLNSDVFSKEIFCAHQLFIIKQSARAAATLSYLLSCQATLAAAKVRQLPFLFQSLSFAFPTTQHGCKAALTRGVVGVNIEGKRPTVLPSIIVAYDVLPEGMHAPLTVTPHTYNGQCRDVSSALQALLAFDDSLRSHAGLPHNLHCEGVYPAWALFDEFNVSCKIEQCIIAALTEHSEYVSSIDLEEHEGSGVHYYAPIPNSTVALQRFFELADKSVTNLDIAVVNPVAMSCSISSSISLRFNNSIRCNKRGATTSMTKNEKVDRNDNINSKSFETALNESTLSTDSGYLSLSHLIHDVAALRHRGIAVVFDLRDVVLLCPLVSADASLAMKDISSPGAYWLHIAVYCGVEGVLLPPPRSASITAAFNEMTRIEEFLFNEDTNDDFKGVVMSTLGSLIVEK